MSVNINTNYNQSFNLNVLKNNTASSSNFAEILNQNIHSTGQSINTQYFGNVSKNEFEDSIKNLLKKMDEIIKSTKEKWGASADKLEGLKQAYEAQVDMFHLSLDMIYKTKLGLDSKNKNEVAQSVEDLVYQTSGYNMILSGLPEVAKNFFNVAGLSSEVKTDLAKIQKYVDDNLHRKVILNDGSTITYGDAAEKDFDSKYIKIKNESKLLEALLQMT